MARRVLLALAVVYSAAAFGITPRSQQIAAKLRASSLRVPDPEQPQRFHISAAPHDSGLNGHAQPREATISTAEAVILPLTAVLAGSALLMMNLAQL